MQWVKVELPAEEFPGYKGERVGVCPSAGKESISGREVQREGQPLCRALRRDRYYRTAFDLKTFPRVPPCPPWLPGFPLPKIQ